MTILIVDDEFRIGQLIRRLIHFEELGLELIDVFDDSEKALGAILLHHPDVVISDIKMPGHGWSGTGAADTGCRDCIALCHFVSGLPGV